MDFWRRIAMGLERVKVSPELVGIIGGWLTMLAFLGSVSLGMNELRADMSDLRVEMSDLRVEVMGEIADLNGRMAHVEDLLKGYIERSRTGGEVAATE